MPQSLQEMADEYAVLEQAYIDRYEVGREALDLVAKLLERSKLISKDTLSQYAEEAREHTGEPVYEIAMLLKALSGRLPIENEAKVLNYWREIFGDRWAEIQFTLGELLRYGEADE